MKSKTENTSAAPQSIFSTGYHAGLVVDDQVKVIKAGVDELINQSSEKATQFKEALSQDVNKELDTVSEKIKTWLTAIIKSVASLANTVPELIKGMFKFLSENLDNLFKYLTSFIPGSAPAAELKSV